MKTWWWILPVFLLVGAGVFFWHKNQRAISEREIEVAAIKPQSTAPITRAPAAKPPAKIIPAKKALPKREWVGKKDEIVKSGRIKFANSVSDEWSLKLEESLLRGMPEDVTLEIKNERDLIVLEGQTATNAQQVVVIFNSPEKRNSYRALVDSQSGRILRSWDHTIHETFRRPAGSKLTAFPLQSP